MLLSHLIPWALFWNDLPFMCCPWKSGDSSKQNSQWNFCHALWLMPTENLSLGSADTGLLLVWFSVGNECQSIFVTCKVLRISIEVKPGASCFVVLYINLSLFNIRTVTMNGPQETESLHCRKYFNYWWDCFLNFMALSYSSTKLSAEKGSSFWSKQFLCLPKRNWSNV